MSEMYLVIVIKRATVPGTDNPNVFTVQSTEAIRHIPLGSKTIRNRLPILGRIARKLGTTQLFGDDRTRLSQDVIRRRSTDAINVSGIPFEECTAGQKPSH